MKFLRSFGTITATLFFLAILTNQGYSLKPALDYLPSLEMTEALCLDKNTERERSTITIEFRQINEGNRSSYMITKQGKGAYANFNNILWEKRAELIEDSGLLKPITSQTVIRDENNKILGRYEKMYDYGKGLINFKKYGENNTLIEERSFGIKGYTCDDITLNYCLRAYAADRERPPFEYFFLLTDEPKYYKTNIQIIGEESLQVSSENMPAIKLKLTGDIGILDNILDRFVPPTYLWYQKNSPFGWLKYQGYEIGYKSPYVTVQRVQ